MRCRQRLCQHVAARVAPPPSNAHHLWISDDLLSEAFNRYLGVSKVSRRYGSNVPGPMEVNRRLAKRKMGVAVGSVGPQPGFDIDALFGLGTAVQPRSNPEMNWKWEAPTPLPKSMFGPPPPPPQAVAQQEQVQADPVAISKAAFKQLLLTKAHLTVVELDDLEHLLLWLRSDQNETRARNVHKLVSWLVDGERKLGHRALEAFTKLINEKLQLSNIPVRDVVSFLRTLPSIVPEEDAASMVWQALELLNLDLLDQRAQTRTTAVQQDLEDALLEALVFSSMASGFRLDVLNARVMHAVPKFVNKHPEATATWIAKLVATVTARALDNVLMKSRTFCIVQILESLPSDRVQQVIGEATARLVRGLPAMLEHSAAALTSEDPRAAISSKRDLTIALWLRCLRRAHNTRDHAVLSVVWRAFAKRYRPSQLAYHLRTLDGKELGLASAIACGWVSEATSADIPDTSVGTPVAGTPDSHLSSNIIDYRDHRRLLPEKPGLINFKQLEDVFQTSGFVYSSWDNEKRRASPTTRLVRLLIEHNVQPAYFAKEIAKIMLATETDDVSEAFNWLKQLRESEVGIFPEVAVEVAKALLQKGMPMKAFYIFESSPSLPISALPELPIMLIKANKGTPERIWAVLHRQVPSALPSGIDSDSNTSPRLTQQHIDLIHLVAWTYARQPYATWRVAYRRVLECYCFLQEQGAILQPLLSRALVHAGVIRALQEKHWVGTEKFKHTLDIVREIEGEQIAEALDVLVQKMRLDARAEVRKRAYRDWNRDEMKLEQEARTKLFGSWTWWKKGPKVWRKNPKLWRRVKLNSDGSL